MAAEFDKHRCLLSELESNPAYPLEQASCKFEQKALDFWAGHLNEGWEVIKNHHLERTYDFDNFIHALEFATILGYLSEDMDHHPSMTLSYGSVKIVIFTHTIDGLFIIDFILASLFDRAYDDYSLR